MERVLLWTSPAARKQYGKYIKSEMPRRTILSLNVGKCCNTLVNTVIEYCSVMEPECISYSRGTNGRADVLLSALAVRTNGLDQARWSGDGGDRSTGINQCETKQGDIRKNVRVGGTGQQDRLWGRHIPVNWKYDSDRFHTANMP